MNELSLASHIDVNQAARLFDHMDISEGTRRDYQWRIGAFIQFLGGEPLNCDSYLHYKQYFERRRDLSVSTKNKYLMAARKWLRELHRRGLIDRDLTLNVRLFQQSKMHKKEGLTPGEVERLTSYLRGLPPSVSNLRLKAILLLLGLQGLRQIEVQRLDVEDIDLSGGTALVLGKGRDDKDLIDLHPQTVAGLRNYLEAARLGSGPLLPDLHHIGGAERITVRAIRLSVRKALDGAGIEHKNVHGLRHYFTTVLLEVFGGDLLAVQRLTRHRSVQMLQIYDDRRRQKADLQRFHGAFAGVQL